MPDDEFLSALQTEAADYSRVVATEGGDWIVKGFIDIYRRVYPVSVDTKVISKVLELLLIPRLITFGQRQGYEVVLAKEQNFYPDLSFVSSETGLKYAVDIKSTYRSKPTKSGEETVNGMTLGAFTGYFRDRASNKNITFPYSAYQAHLILGVVYSRISATSDESQVFQLSGGKQTSETDAAFPTITDLDEISSSVRDFTFFVQPKYRIASSRPGSGNTKNIGSIRNLQRLLHGDGPFAKYGEEVYDDYWMYYLTQDMADKAKIERPYFDWVSYVKYKQRGLAALPAESEAQADQEAELIEVAPDSEEDEA